MTTIKLKTEYGFIVGCDEASAALLSHCSGGRDSVSAEQWLEIKPVVESHGWQYSVNDAPFEVMQKFEECP